MFPDAHLFVKCETSVKPGEVLRETVLFVGTLTERGGREVPVWCLKLPAQGTPNKHIHFSAQNCVTSHTEQGR